MPADGPHRNRSVLIWLGSLGVSAAPIIAAAFSPLLAWREPIYIAAGFAGILSFVFMLVQPMLAAGYLPGLAMLPGRRIHRALGSAIIVFVVLHVFALWLTSLPDVIDALLLRSPTSFSIWGVLAMWLLFAAALLAVLKRKLPLRLWRTGHSTLVTLAVLGTVLHVLLIDGTMEFFTKLMLSVVIVAVLAKALFDLRAWSSLLRKRSNGRK